MWRSVTLIGVLVVLPATALAQQPCTPNAQRVVDAIYRQVLERPADRGSATQVERLNNGSASVRDLVREVAKSQEHLQRFLPGSNRDEDARFLYKHLLSRQPDPEGLRGHAQALANTPPASVIDGFIDSSEYQQSFGDDVVPGSRLRYCASGSGGEDSGPINRSGAIRFRNMDVNNDGAISRNEWRGSRESFVVNDWNGDNVLSGEEVRVGGRRSARIEDDDFDPATPDRFSAWTEASFLNLDHNRDGRITSNEWHYSAMAFRSADRNRDGALTLPEFTDTTVDDNRDDRFENLDVNNNGRIERGEWHGSADAFGWLDRNNDSVLSRAEVAGNSGGNADRFANLDMNRDGRLSSDEWHWSRRSFDRRDTNQDGVITRREFTATAP